MKVLKWILFIICILIIAIAITSYFLLRSNSSYVLKHLEKHPEKSSLYITVNDDEKVAYQSNQSRPLASVAKITIALEYAYQLESGKVKRDDETSLTFLENFYIPNTDGGAHEAWLDDMEGQGKIQHNAVHLHDVAKGMMTYSSNANADFLIDMLGADNINARMENLGLEHDPIIPFAGSLAAITDYQQNHDDWEEDFKDMSDADYRELTFNKLEEMKQATMDVENASEASLTAQRIWSDQLANAPAKTYGTLLQMSVNDEFPESINTTIRDLMEWPMEKVPENKEYYKAVGAKGGSTGYVLNDTMYVETLDGQQISIVIFFDDLSFWQKFMLQRQMNNFMVEAIKQDTFPHKIEETL